MGVLFFQICLNKEATEVSVSGVLLAFIGERGVSLGFMEDGGNCLDAQPSLKAYVMFSSVCFK